MQSISEIPGKAKRLFQPRLLACAVALAGPSLASAAVLYKTGFGSYDGNNNASFTTTIATYTATGGTAVSTAAGGRGEGRGDDYSTIYSSLTVTSLRFVGSLQSNADGLAIEFYNPDGSLNNNSTIYPSNTLADFRTSTVHTVTLSAPVTISGSGYVIFAPYTYSYNTSSDSPQVSLGYSDGYNAALYDVGTNNASSSVEANYVASYPLSVDRTISTVHVPFTTDRLTFELDGTGVPEPTTLAMLTPVALLLKRRQRA